jgi:hypothetical protein
VREENHEGIVTMDQDNILSMQQYPCRHDLMPRMIEQQQQKQLSQQQGINERESNSIGQRRILNPIMVEYQT